jgi:hypothetical protein
MTKTILGLLTVGFFFMLLSFPRSTQATMIQFTATDIDNGPGGDYWQYSYVLSDATFQKDSGFSIYFDRTLYGTLESLFPDVHADWDILTFQPDLALQADGFYDALALVNDASLVAPFTVQFVWLGAPGTTPGAQPFTINTFDTQGGFSETETGQTQTPVPTPEPSSSVLFGTGLAGLLGLHLAMRHARI